MTILIKNVEPFQPKASSSRALIDELVPRGPVSVFSLTGINLSAGGSVQVSVLPYSAVCTKCSLAELT